MKLFAMDSDIVRRRSLTGKDRARRVGECLLGALGNRWTRRRSRMRETHAALVSPKQGHRVLRSRWSRASNNCHTARWVHRTIVCNAGDARPSVRHRLCSIVRSYEREERPIGSEEIDTGLSNLDDRLHIPRGCSAARVDLGEHLRRRPRPNIRQSRRGGLWRRRALKRSSSPQTLLLLPTFVAKRPAQQTFKESHTCSSRT